MTGRDGKRLPFGLLPELMTAELQYSWCIV
jgi:hypothetical protein